MRINLDNNSCDIEPRDWNFIFPQYIRSYLFYSKNKDPVEMVIPMFPSVPHPFDNSRSIPVRWVPFTNPTVTEIIEDGKDVPEMTQEEVAKLDEKDAEIARLRATIEEMETKPLPPEDTTLLQQEDNAMTNGLLPTNRPSIEEAMGTTTPSSTDRAPRLPDNPIAGPSQLDGMQSRDVKRDVRRTAKDLIPEPDIDESKEIATEIEKPK